jgi:NADPH:quinone reductase-like Zn-dependent oxidoreductase
MESSITVSVTRTTWDGKGEDGRDRRGGRTRYIEQALREVAAGVLATVIGQTFPLDRAGAAHAAIESRTVFGKTLIIARG